MSSFGMVRNRIMTYQDVVDYRMLTCEEGVTSQQAFIFE